MVDLCSFLINSVGRQAGIGMKAYTICMYMASPSSRSTFFFSSSRRKSQVLVAWAQARAQVVALQETAAYMENERGIEVAAATRKEEAPKAAS